MLLCFLKEKGRFDGISGSLSVAIRYRRHKQRREGRETLPIQETRSPQPKTARVIGASDRCGRGAIEERRRPAAGNRRQHWNRDRSRCVDEDDGRGNNGYRGRRVHHDANGAMIGVRGGGMNVHHLNQGHQAQDQQADEGSGAHRPGAALATSLPSMLGAPDHKTYAHTTRIHRFDVAAGP